MRRTVQSSACSSIIAPATASASGSRPHASTAASAAGGGSRSRCSTCPTCSSSASASSLAISPTEISTAPSFLSSPPMRDVQRHADVVASSRTQSAAASAAAWTSSRTRSSRRPRVARRSCALSAPPAPPAPPPPPTDSRPLFDGVGGGTAASPPLPPPPSDVSHWVRSCCWSCATLGSSPTRSHAAASKQPRTAASEARCTWMVKRSEDGDLGGLWLKGHGLSVGSDLLGLSPRVRRAAPSLQMQSDEPVAASSGLAKTATLTMLVHRHRRLAGAARPAQADAVHLRAGRKDGKGR